MIIYAPILRRPGLKRLTKLRWRAIDDDPQIVIAPRLLGARFLIISIYSDELLLDPCLYVDTGEGFDPDEEIQFTQASSAIYVVNLQGDRRIRRVRFDPSSFPAEFSIRTLISHNEIETRNYVAKAIQKHNSSGSSNRLICETIDLSNSAKLEKKRRALSPNNHFNQVIAMAAEKYGSKSEPSNYKLISFITPVFNAASEHLDQLLQSLTSQLTSSWELILIDDASTSKETQVWLNQHNQNPRIKILRNEKNVGIAITTNRGIKTAKGEWVAFLDHDDAIAPYALEVIQEVIERHPEAQLIYTDEVIADKKLTPRGYFLKPAFDPILLSGVNYINHLTLYKRERLINTRSIREGFDGSQDYDLLLRYTANLKNSEVIHVPYPAYLWRRHDASYSSQSLHLATERARLSLAEVYSVDDKPVYVDEALDKTLHRVRFDKSKQLWPSISIIIPSKNAFELISRLLDDLYLRTDYPDLEIIITDNGSRDINVLDLYSRTRAAHNNFSVDMLDGQFNFSRSINRGIKKAKNDFILLLNNDIEIIEKNWLKEMVSCFDYKDVGIVGARLLYPNDRLQHAGVIVGLGSVAGHWFCGTNSNQPGPMNRLKVRQSFSAVTGACMLISRQCLDAVGLFDETHFAVAYNDIDFCLRAGQKGYRVAWTPFASLYHYESATRGSDETEENIARFNREKRNLRERYNLKDYIDPAFSPWYTREHAIPRLFLPQDLPDSRIFLSKLNN